jgi:hypothetical protein
MRNYCKVFHLIDKGNGKEAKCDMTGQSQLHNWAPKLVFCLFKMVLNNVYIICKDLAMREDRKCLPMGKVVKELVHGLCQCGPPVCVYAATHPEHLRDMD